VIDDAGVKLGIALLLLALAAAALCAGEARANGDPASDVLPFSTVYFSLKNPQSAASGRDLLKITQVAAKKKQPIRVAVIAMPSDLGLIQSIWLKPQTYAEFLGKELFQFARYKGTTLIVMPNGYGVYGPLAGKGRPALDRLPKPGTSDLDKLGEHAATATRRVAAANGFVLPPPSRGSSGTPTWAVLAAGVGGAALVAGVVFLGLRRWLLAD
jgi:hypothetical protein